MSPGNASLLLRHGRVIDPGRLDGPADVLVQDGKIAAIGRDLSVPAGIEILDASGKYIFPGFVDLHVHLREPGFEYKETIKTGMAAAAAARARPRGGKPAGPGTGIANVWVRAEPPGAGLPGPRPV